MDIYNNQGFLKFSLYILYIKVKENKKQLHFMYLKQRELSRLSRIYYKNPGIKLKRYYWTEYCDKDSFIIHGSNRFKEQHTDLEKLSIL